MRVGPGSGSSPAAVNKITTQSWVPFLGRVASTQHAGPRNCSVFLFLSKKRRKFFLVSPWSWYSICGPEKDVITIHSQIWLWAWLVPLKMKRWAALAGIQQAPRGWEVTKWESFIQGWWKGVKDGNDAKEKMKMHEVSWVICCGYLNHLKV